LSLNVMKLVCIADRFAAEWMKVKEVHPTKAYFAS
jgi:hypothetical protein